jgi:hypothetical protein
MNSEKWRFIRNNLVIVDYGPINMTIEAWSKLEPNPIACKTGALTAIKLLEELSQHLDMAKQPFSKITPEDCNAKTIPKVLQYMCKSVSDLAEDDFTPMAAVAGTFSDFVLQSALAAGADRVMVNNGGDLSFAHGHCKKPFTIGLVADLVSGQITHTLISMQENIQNRGGAATSGIGGRSLTKGIASAVTCLATTSSKADAAATSIANATDCEHSEIKKISANRVDAMTDIGDALVTCHVGKLPLKAKQKALENGMERANVLIKKKIIEGCFISVQGMSLMCPENIAKPVNFVQ